MRFKGQLSAGAAKLRRGNWGGGKVTGAAAGGSAIVGIAVQRASVGLGKCGATMLGMRRKPVAGVPEADSGEHQIGQYEN